MRATLTLASGLILGSSGAVLAADPATILPGVSNFDWSGAYIGAQVGGGWTNVKQPWGFAPPATIPQDDADGNGILGGVHAGYNWQSGSFVFGAEADINAAGIDGDDGGNGGDTNGFKAEWIGSLRARAGVAFDRVLFYGTGGYAYLGGKADVRDPGRKESHSVSFNGWTIGAGVEYAFTNNITVRGEYRYADFGSENVDFPASGYIEEISPSLQIVQIGLSYKF